MIPFVGDDEQAARARLLRSVARHANDEPSYGASFHEDSTTGAPSRAEPANSVTWNKVLARASKQVAGLRLTPPEVCLERTRDKLGLIRAFIYVIDKLLIPTETDGPDGSEKTAHKQLMDVHREHQRKSFVRGRVLEHLRLKYEAAVARQDAAAQYSISMNIADTHMKQDQPSEAREWLMNSLDLAIKRGLPPTSLLGAVRSLARLHQQTGKHTDAVQQGRVLLCSAVKAGDVHFEGEACHLLAVSYAALGEREQATRMDARYLRLALHGATLEEQAQVPGVHKLRSQGSWGEIDTDLAPEGRLVNLQWSFRDGKFAERRAAPALPEVLEEDDAPGQRRARLHPGFFGAGRRGQPVETRCGADSLGGPRHTASKIGP